MLMPICLLENFECETSKIRGHLPWEGLESYTVHLQLQATDTQ